MLTHTQKNVREVINLSTTVNILYFVIVKLTNNIIEVWKCRIKTKCSIFCRFVIDFIYKCDRFLLVFTVCVLTDFGRGLEVSCSMCPSDSNL